MWRVDSRNYVPSRSQVKSNYLPFWAVNPLLYSSQLRSQSWLYKRKSFLCSKIRPSASASASDHKKCFKKMRGAMPVNKDKQPVGFDNLLERNRSFSSCSRCSKYALPGWPSSPLGPEEPFACPGRPSSSLGPGWSSSPLGPEEPFGSACPGRPSSTLGPGRPSSPLGPG